MNITRNHSRFNDVPDHEQMPCARSFSRLQQRSPSQHEHQDSPPRRFLRLLKSHYPTAWQAWRTLRRQRVVREQQWRLIGGPYAGCVISFAQNGLCRQVRIFCPDDVMACALQSVKPQIEMACSGPWIMVHVTIEVDSEKSVYP